MNRKYLFGSTVAAVALTISACSSAPSTGPVEASSSPSSSLVVTSNVPRETSSTANAPEPTASEPLVAPCEPVTEKWDTLDDSTAISIGYSEVLNVRAGAHDCFDRIVIEVGTLYPVGFQVGYVDQVSLEGSGLPVSVDGGAVLRVVINTWGKRFVQCNWRYDWKSLREVTCAGSHEAMTTFAVGLDHRTPFAVYHLADSAKGTMRVIIDIAH